MTKKPDARQQCLVTGGAGFLGRHLVDALTDTFEVTIFDVRESGDPSAKAFIGDIRELDSVRQACSGSMAVTGLLFRQETVIIVLCIRAFLS